jgi:Domain of unknown function (DUF1996)
MATGWHRTRAAPALAAAGALVLLAAIAGAAAASGPEGRVANDERSFVTLCAFSHRNTDDPIVLPRRPGFSHDHTFVGNVSTDAFSTLKSLRSAKTTCDRKDDLAAYWAPTLLDDGKPLDPFGAVVYYRRLTKARVRPYPSGLTMVAGNSHSGVAQSRRVVFWDCGLVKTTLYGVMARGAEPVATPPAASSTPPACPPASKLQLHVNFPDCWNGKSLDSFDHHRHMAYSVRGVCPRSHPVAVPALSLVYQYPLPTGTVALSSGGVYSAHADFVNAWDEDTLTKLVDNCLNAYRPCGIGS